MGFLRNSFLGAIAEVCIVSGNHKKDHGWPASAWHWFIPGLRVQPNHCPKTSLKGPRRLNRAQGLLRQERQLDIEIMQPTGGESLIAEHLNQVFPQNLC